MIDKELQNKIQQQLRYTNRDYETILTTIISLFQGDDPITENWSNMSSSDPYFLILHLLAAHLDITNYQLDYQTLEGYMSTAKERASIVRIANSFGYKIPSYKAAYAEYELTKTQIMTLGTFEFIPYETTYLDNKNVAWTYVGPNRLTSDQMLQALVNDKITIPFYQGTSLRLEMPASEIDLQSKTHIISNQRIAIGNNKNNLGTSSLRTKTSKVFTEIDNLNTYVGTLNNEDFDYVYELNVDPQGITYLRLPSNFNYDLFRNDVFELDYLITEGKTVVNNGPISGYINTTINSITTSKEITLQQKPNTLVNGSDPMDTADITNNFTKYYAGPDTLVTLEDYKHFIEKQKEVLNINKVLVLDQDGNTGDFENDLTTKSKIDNLEVVLYILKDNNEELTNNEIDLLNNLLKTKRVTGLTTSINKTKLTTNGSNNPITETKVYVDLGLNKAELAGVRDSIKDLIIDYVNKKEIGSSISTSELYSLILRSEYAPYFYAGIQVQLAKEDNPGSYVNTEIKLNFNEYGTATRSTIK